MIGREPTGGVAISRVNFSDRRKTVAPRGLPEPGPTPYNKKVEAVNASTLLSLEQARYTAASVLDCLERMDERARLVGLALLAEQHAPFHGNGSFPDHPLLESVRISGESVGRYNAVRSLFPDPTRDIEQFESHIEDLGNTNFDPCGDDAGNAELTFPAHRPQNGDRLFDIVRVKEWDNPQNWNSSGYSWLVRAGQWGYWNMSESSRVLLCRIAGASLTHRDLATCRLTLKLGRQLGFSLLLRGENRPLEMTAEQLLGDVGEWPEATERTTDWAGAMHRRFNMALFSLCNLGALRDIGWPASYRFVGVDGDGGVPANWTTSTISFKAPSIPAREGGKSPYQPIHLFKI